MNAKELLLGCISCQMVWVLLFLFYTTTYGQIPNDLYELHSHKVQPEHWSFGKPQDIGVDAKGDISISIPVLIIEGRKIQYPVNFTYNAGIKPDQMPSWIGLGWSFDPGSISRDIQSGHPISISMGGTGNYHGVDVFESGGADRLPDIFYFNMPDYGGFSFIQSNRSGIQPQTVPDYQFGDFIPDHQRPVRIEAVTGPVCVSVTSADSVCTGVNYTLTPEGFIQKDDIRKFLVTTEDGTRYLFGNPTLTFADNVFLDNGIQKPLRQFYVNTWRILWILGPEYTGNPWLAPASGAANSWIRFEYDPAVTYKPSRFAHDSWKFASESRFGQTQFLNKIVTPMQSVDFVTQHRVDPIDAFDCEPRGEPNECKVNNYNKKLTQINAPTRRIVLVSENGPQAFPPYVQPAGQSNVYGRLRLNALRFFNANGIHEEPGYAFTYYESPKLSYNHPLSGNDNWPATPEMNALECRDDFGYLRDQSVLYCYPGNGQSWAWSLGSIIHPTGAKDSVIYELNVLFDGDFTVNTEIGTISINNKVPYVKILGLGSSEFVNELYEVTPAFPERINQGGVRVKKLLRFDGNGNILQTDFEYGLGLLNGVPPGEFGRIFPETRTVVANNNRRGDIGVYYDWILRKTKDLISGDSTMSKTWYSSLNNYSNTSLDGSVSTPIGVNAIKRTKSIVYISTYNCLDYDSQPFPEFMSCRMSTVIQDEHHQFWGHVIKQEFYNDLNYANSGQLNLTKRIISSIEYNRHSNAPVIGTIWKNTGSYPFFDYNVVNTDYYYYYKRTTTETVFEYLPEYDLGQLTTITSWSHDSRTNQITQETRSGTDAGVSQVTRMEYAFDKYPAMKNSNRITQLARIDNLAGAQYVSSTVYTWRTPPGRSYFAPWRLFTWKSDLTSSSQPVFNNWSSGTTPAGWIRLIDLSAYDQHGNPTNIIGPKGDVITMSYAHFATRPNQISFRRTPGSTSGQITLNFYNYNVFGQPGRIRDEANTNTYYTYDVFGRLTGISNHASEPLSTTVYHPFQNSLNGWAFSNTHI